VNEVEIKKALVVKPSSLGDVVHSLPFLHSLKKCFPGLRVHWVIAEPLKDLLEGHPLIEKLWVIKKDNWKKPARIFETLSEFKALSKNLKKERFDIAFDLQGLLRSGIIIKSSGAKVRVGFKEAREGGHLFYTHKVEGGKGIHAVERYLKLAESIAPGVLCQTEIEFPLIRAKDFTPPFKEYAVLAPGARWASKRWPAGDFGKLAAMLPLKSVIIGSNSEKALADEVARTSGGNAVSFAGKSGLKELVELIRQARFMVTNDSGPMHIAAALGVPVFAVFGPTDPALTGPYGKGMRVVLREKADCAPCRNRDCPDMKCMRAITPERLLEEIKRAIFPLHIHPHPHPPPSRGRGPKGGMLQ